MTRERNLGRQMSVDIGGNKNDNNHGVMEFVFRMLGRLHYFLTVFRMLDCTF